MRFQYETFRVLRVLGGYQALPANDSSQADMIDTGDRAYGKDTSDLPLALSSGRTTRLADYTG